MRLGLGSRRIVTKPLDLNSNWLDYGLGAAALA
jgi:hypothetical protein